MQTIWLSHVLSEDTPLYGGEKDIHISKLKSIDNGDSCNAGQISMPFHSGTHVDAPLHFVNYGASISDLCPDDWIFNDPMIMEIKTVPGQLIEPKDLCLTSKRKVDFIIIKTGFEKHRKESIYWESGPGISADCADALLNVFPGLKGIGFDFISISSLRHREMGRKAHKAFLEKRILIIEDMSLNKINSESKLRHVTALPLRIDQGDGAPVTIIGVIE